MKVLIKHDHKFLIKDKSKDYHTQYGVVSSKDLSKSKAKTNKGTEFFIFDASFIDIYEKMKRQAQIITPKDIGTIISETGINKDSKVLDAGSGSGALCCFLANICKKVVSYDIREDHQKTAKHNMEMLGLKNLTFKLGDVREKISEKDFDLIILDMPDPWNALGNAKAALKNGGFLVIYSPTIPQVMDTVSKIKTEFSDSFIFLKTLETIQRPWDVDERKVRPVSSYINHTAFLTFIRRI
ncbi:MAG: tRNA (adenine-N1)-methyltransferase [Candidatus Woesearchaeota archaeon]